MILPTGVAESKILQMGKKRQHFDQTISLPHVEGQRIGVF
jgi:hypothetical protein